MSTLELKNYLLSQISNISEESKLLEIKKFLKNIVGSNTSNETTTNIEDILKVTGTLSDEDAKEMTEIVNREFNNIEGDW